MFTQKHSFFILNSWDFTVTTIWVNQREIYVMQNRIFTIVDGIYVLWV